MNVQADPSLSKGVIDPLPASPDQPIRSTFFHEARLRNLGEELARSKVAVPGFKGIDFQRRIRDNGDRILEVYRATNEAQGKGDAITPAAQWLLDNHYLIGETVFQVKRDLPRRFYRELPVESFAGHDMPRALAIAWAYVAHSDSSVSAAMFEAIVEGYQSVEPLKIGELWALPSLLRFVLIENLRRLAIRVDRARKMRRIANRLADRVLAEEEGEGRENILASYAGHARDTTFATQLLYRLRDGSRNAGRALVWLENELERHGSNSEAVIFAEHQTLSSGNVTTANIVRGLRQINDTDWTKWFEKVSRVDALLRKEAGLADLDFPSRDLYRRNIEDLARRSGITELGVAEHVVAKAKNAAADPDISDIGFFLAGERRGELEQAIGYRVPFATRFGRAYCKAGWLGIVGPAVAIAAILLAMIAAALGNIGLHGASIGIMLAVLALPAIDAGLSLFNKLAMMLLKPTRLVGYEFKQGVPASARTLVVVPSLIGSRDDVDESVRNLEVHFLANMHGDIYFALLSDWPDSPIELSGGDREVLDYAREEIKALNERHPVHGVARFHLLHRRRLYNESQSCWMGWERKRGKLHELDLLLRGDADTTFMPPDTPLPDQIVHVMTLDADTRMTRDAVTRLAGKMSHPLNRPRTDPKSGRVVRGHGVLQPRVTASLTTGDEASFFQRVFSANRGLDPYVFTVSDLYQDVFDDGTYTGKGMYHIDAMEAALKGRIAENQVLSHDLLEGELAGGALVTDVELVEDYPTRYDVDASRQHRWARGDWQLLPYILGRRGPIPSLGRWKMVDNLRRTLTPIAWVIASVAGWTMLPFDLATQLQALLILMMFMAPTFDLVDAIVPNDTEITARGHLNALWRETALASAQVALRIVLLAHSAWLMGDAIVRTLYRLNLSNRDLLEWRTALQAHKSGDNTIIGYYRTMYGAVVIGLAGLAIPLAAGSSGAGVALIFALFWTGSPAFAWLISRSAETEDRLIVAEADKATLRAYGRRTWLYFETFVTSEHNMLPPDNFQETPVPIVANRTSPTNIGVYLLSVISARDFGWISLVEATDRLAATLATVEKLPAFRGHLYNWYETTTLAPLSPRYVSSVDSGNLAGHLIAVAAACNEWATAPAAFLEGDFHGLLDVVMILEQSLTAVPDDRRQLRPLRQRLRERVSGIRRAIDTVRSEPETAAIRTINLVVLAGEIRKLAAAIHQETQSDHSSDLARWAMKLEATAEAHVSDSHFDENAIERVRERLENLREAARMLAFRMDFSFLLRQDRNLLSIGYRVDERQLDESCYDLLASEARLTSLFAIAKGDVPTNHWFRLGRPIVEIGFSGALMSWAGSMFEYLMPPLVMKEPQGGILNQTSHLIIKRQIQLRPLEGHSVGHLGSRLQRPRPRDDLPVHEFRRARARPETRPGAKHRHCALCDHARRAVQAARGRPEPGGPAQDRRARTLRLLRIRRLHAEPRAGGRRPCRRRQLHGPPSGHVGRFRRQRHLRRPHARPLPQRPGHRGGRIAAAGKSAARHPDRDRSHRRRRPRHRGNHLRQPRQPPHPRSAERLAGHQRDVERPVFGDGDGDRHRLQPARRHLDHALAKRPDRRPHGQLPVRARRRDRRMVVGHARSEERTGRDGADDLQRREGQLRQICRQAQDRSRMHRRDRGQRRGTPHHDLERRRQRPPYRSHLLRRTGVGTRSRRQRPPGVLEDVRADPDRPRRRRDLRAPPATFTG